jgi:Xaa-Pro aminopeptidase
MNKLGVGVLILPAYPERLLSNDTNFKFRQNSDLLYFTGFPEPDTVAVIENNGNGLIYHLFVPKRDPKYETWNGRRYGIKGAIEFFQADKAYIIDEVEKELPELLKKYENVFYNDETNPEFDIVLKSLLKKARNNKERTGFGPIHVTNPLSIIHQSRCIKSDQEIETLRKVAKISADAHTKAMMVTKPGMYEYEIEAIIDYEFRKNGCARPAYPSICGSGVNGTILHYIENGSMLKDGDLLLVDAGGELNSYGADITRTWPINGRFSTEQKELYELVLDVQKQCIDLIKPGVILGDIQKKSVEMITEGLIKFGLLEGTKEENITEKKYERFYMHGLGHWLGLDVHDSGKVDKDKVKLLPNYYFTIEPGIYIPEDDDIPEKYKGIGIRIEDDILVTIDGYEVLTHNVVKEVKEIENIVGTMDLP